MVNHDSNFPNIYINPLKLNTSFFPYEFVNQNTTTEISVTQIYLYEVLINFFSYINELYGLGQSLEESIKHKITSNCVILSCFLIGLMGGNLIIVSICLIFLKKFEKLANLKLNTLDKLITTKKVIDSLNEKVDIIVELSQLYKTNPTKLFFPLSKLTKNNSNTKSNAKKKNNSNKDKNNNKEAVAFSFQEKKFNTKQITLKFKLIIILYFIFCLLFALMFVYIYLYSFNQLRDISHTLEYSANGEGNVFLFITIFQLFHFFTYYPSSFYNIIPNVIDPPSNNETKFLVILLNQLQDDWKKELDYKNGKNKIPNHQDIMNVTCETMYGEMNDIRFNQIISQYPEKHYEQQLINFCNHDKALIYGRDKLVTENILFRITKLLLTSNNNDPNHVLVSNKEERYNLLSEIFFIYRPLRTKFGNYYFEVVLDDKLFAHDIYLIIFLLGIIILQIIKFFMIKFCFFNKIEDINQNVDRLNHVLKCI